MSFKWGRNETDLNTAKQVNKVFIKGTDGPVSVRRDVLFYCVEINRVVNHFVVVRLTASTTAAPAMQQQQQQQQQQQGQLPSQFCLQLQLQQHVILEHTWGQVS